MVYGTTLRLPGQYFTVPSQRILEITFLPGLTESKMTNFLLPKRQTIKDLQNCTHFFFVLWNLVRSNFLQLSYCRHFKAQKSQCKVLLSTLKADLSVFWDSLKFAFCDISLLDSTTPKEYSSPTLSDEQL